jgi:hypothetical protein
MSRSVFLPCCYGPEASAKLIMRMASIVDLPMV